MNSFCNFNSIKVRLEQSDSIQGELYVKFQFHKGTIRTHVSWSLLIHFHVFQFHKGTIRTVGNGHFNDFFADFNSIKVRLEQ